MTVVEALRRLKVDHTDDEAVKAIIGEFDSYIDSMINKYKNSITGMDEQDIKQEIHLKMLSRVSDIDLRLNPQEIDSYFKTSIRNKLIRMTRESKKEMHTMESIDKKKQIDEGEDEISLEQTLADVNDDVERAAGDSYFIETLMESLSPKAQKIVEVILESEGSIKKIQEALEEFPEYSSSKGVIKRVLDNEIKPALEKMGVKP